MHPISIVALLIACECSQVSNPQPECGAGTSFGRKEVICILVTFLNFSSFKSSGEIQGILNRMTSYWNEVSYGLLNLSTTLTEWYELSHPMWYYGMDYGDIRDLMIRDLVEEAIKLADESVDFRLYDYVMIIHAGPGQEVSSLLLEELLPEWDNTIWSCALSNLNVSSRDGINIEKVAVVPEIEMTLFETYDVLGVYAHEFAHLLGLPDLYDQKKQVGEDTLVGDWSLMSSGATLGDINRPCHLGAWSKRKLGWVFPKTVTMEEKIESVGLKPLEKDQDESVIMITLSNSAYYLVELRLRTGFDDHLPDEGVIITFIDESDPENPRIEVMDNHPSTPTKDDAAFHFMDQFNSDGVNILVTEENETCFTVAFSSQPFPDKDNDGLLDLLEEHFGTDANNSDTDGDGLTDGYEALLCETSPTVSDSDGDGVVDGRECELGTSPMIPDTDGDYWKDGIDPFPTDNKSPNWILILFVLFSSPFSLAFLSRKFYAPEHETYKDTIRYRGSGIFLVILGLLSSYGAVALFMAKGIHIFPPFSYPIWGLIAVVVLAFFYFGFLLAKQGKEALQEFYRLQRHARITTPTPTSVGRQDMRKCPRCESLKLGFTRSEDGKRLEIRCYDCGETWREQIIKPARYRQPERELPPRPQKRVILAVHEENGFVHVHESVGDPPEITQEEYEHLLERAKQKKDAVILVSKLNVNGHIVIVPRELPKED